MLGRFQAVVDVLRSATDRVQDVHHSIPAAAITASGTTVALLNFLDTVVRIGAGAAAFVASCYAIAYYRRHMRDKRDPGPP